MTKRKNREEITQLVREFIGDHPDILQILIEFINEHPDLHVVVPDILRTYLKLVRCFDSGNSLFICGNGGSFADSLHISGEMLKSFVIKRPLSADDKIKFDGLPNGDDLSSALEYGLPVHVLGLNLSLFTALENDNNTRYIGFAQELYALGKKGDLLLGISTSGNALNVRYAAVTAKAKEMTTLALTGRNGGELGKIVDIAINVPATRTDKVQEMHQPVYHTLCRIIEAHYFKTN